MKKYLNGIECLNWLLLKKNVWLLLCMSYHYNENELQINIIKLFQWIFNPVFQMLYWLKKWRKELVWLKPNRKLDSLCVKISLIGYLKFVCCDAIERLKISVWLISHWRSVCVCACVACVCLRTAHIHWHRGRAGVCRLKTITIEPNDSRKFFNSPSSHHSCNSIQFGNIYV